MTACRICRGTRIHKMDCPERSGERRATVAEVDSTKSLSASARHLYSTLEGIQMGFETTIELSTALDRLGDAIQEHISAIEDSRLSLLERALGEIIESTRRYLEAASDSASLIPEQDTDWPDGYDFAALDASQTEESESMNSLRSKLSEADALLRSISAARELLAKGCGKW